MSTPSPENSSRAPEIRPALTDEEWGVHIESGNDFITEYWAELIIRGRPTTEDERSHALAALCLHDHPAGFRRWMVEWMACRTWGVVPEELEPTFRTESDVDDYIAARISALLPPKDRKT